VFVLRLLLPLLVLALPMPSSAAAPGERLRDFLGSTVSLSADFVQTRTGEGDAETQQASGRLRLQRPGLFRWDYVTPYEQLILADGERLWIYDPDLEQATVRPQAEALGNSPARLLSGGLDLDANFAVIETNRRDGGLDWVELRPRDGEEEFSEVHLGFSAQGLASMVMIDNLGFTTSINFNNISKNTQIDSDVFSFTPPPGVDVLGD
jgi:outer membrane lipoprotein carrier protein